MRRALGALRAAALCLLGAVVAVNGALLFSRFVLGQDPARVFGLYPLIVTTGSMEPALPAGALVIVRAQESYEVRDIISFREEGAVVTHRIIEETAEGYRTAGDANNAPDSAPVSAQAVLGRVVACLPWAGRLLLFLREPAGILALAAGGAALILLPGGRRGGQYEDTEKKG